MLNFTFNRLPLNGDLPYPPEAHPFCLVVTAEWLEEEGYNPSEWTLYKGVAFSGYSLITAGMYNDKPFLAEDPGGRRSPLVSKEWIDEMTDLDPVIYWFNERGYVLDHCAGHPFAAQNFIGYTHDKEWVSWMEYGDSFQEWWEMLPPCITQPVIELWLRVHEKEVADRISQLLRWEKETLALKEEFPDITLQYEDDSVLSRYPELESPPKLVKITHEKLPFPFINAIDARKYLLK